MQQSCKTCWNPRLNSLKQHFTYLLLFPPAFQSNSWVNKTLRCLMYIQHIRQVKDKLHCTSLVDDITVYKDHKVLYSICAYMMSSLLLTSSTSDQFPFMFNESLCTSDLYWWVTRHLFSLTALHASSIVLHKIQLKEQMGSPLSVPYMCVGVNERQRKIKRDSEERRLK